MYCNEVKITSSGVAKESKVLGTYKLHTELENGKAAYYRWENRFSSLYLYWRKVGDGSRKLAGKWMVKRIWHCIKEIKSYLNI